MAHLQPPAALASPPEAGPARLRDLPLPPPSRAGALAAGMQATLRVQADARARHRQPPAEAYSSRRVAVRVRFSAVPGACARARRCFRTCHALRRHPIQRREPAPRHAGHERNARASLPSQGRIRSATRAETAAPITPRAVPGRRGRRCQLRAAVGIQHQCSLAREHAESLLSFPVQRRFGFFFGF